MAREALERRGVAEPAAHILLAAQRVKRTFPPKPDSQMIGVIVGDLPVKQTPFSDRDVELVRSFLEPNGFELRLAPGAVGDPTIARILGAPGDDLERILDEQAFALAPVTDDRPFFYHILRWGSLLSGERTVWYFPGSTIGQIMLLIMLGQALLLGGALILLQLPLGIALGMYFPTGVELLRQRDPRLVPWAWAVNGVASVASSVLAVILGMAIGFAGVALLAAAVYVVGTLALLSILPGQSETAVGHF